MSAAFWYYFGWPDGAVWSNLLASALCALLVWWRLHRQAALHHAEALVQAAKHHLERTGQAEDLKRHVSAQLNAHCSDLKSHVTAVGSHVLTAAVPVPQQLLDDIRNAPKPKPGGDPP